MAELPIAVVDDERFDGHRSMEMHPERPERLVAARAGLKRAAAPGELVRVAARPVNDEEVLRVHSETYLRGLRDALRAGWGHIDADTFFCPQTEEAAWLAAGGAVELCRAVVDGPVRRGIALLRPPGHHACPSRAMGFCLLNNIAIAAADALARGLSRVAIVDFDVHHGNGTQDIFYEDARVLFVSLHQSPLYPGTGRVEERGARGGEGYTVNAPMPPGSGPEAYGAAFRELVLPALRSFDAELVLVSSGLDGHRRDPLAQLELDANCFGAMTTALADHVDEAGHGRLALFLEGGYDLHAIEESVHAMVMALGGERYELA
ncbi:MAG: histone deacetylase [Myxococcales bacterium]|nr:MAG: histone deacetylase [Myxococcales bacterium]